MLASISQRTFANKKLTCAQKVFIANKEKYNVTEREIALAKNCGTGHAEGGVCGALYIASLLVEDPAKKEKIREAFIAKAGSDKCKKIRKLDKLSCAECVATANELIAQFD